MLVDVWTQMPEERLSLIRTRIHGTTLFFSLFYLMRCFMIWFSNPFFRRHLVRRQSHLVRQSSRLISSGGSLIRWSSCLVRQSSHLTMPRCYSHDDCGQGVGLCPGCRPRLANGQLERSDWFFRWRVLCARRFIPCASHLVSCAIHHVSCDCHLVPCACYLV